MARKAKETAAGKEEQEKEKATKFLRPATVNRELACLKHLFSRNSELVARNPVKGVKFFAENNEQCRVLTTDEEKRYLLAATQPLQDIATLMLETGMRPEEACRIRRENVNLGEGYVFIPFGKTKAARRKLALSERAYNVLLHRINDTEIKGEHLFPGRGEGDKPLVKVNHAHTSAVKRSGVKPFVLYALRHTFATRAVEAGVDLVTLAAMLGHSRLAMVMRYAHPSEEHQFEAMRKIRAYRKTAQG